MRGDSLLLIVAGIGLALWSSGAFAAQQGDVSIDGDNGDMPVDSSGATDAIPTITLQGADMNSQIAALLAVIGQFESHSDYYILYGGGHFSDDSRHPNQRIPINLPGYEGKVSTAAGKYQINFPTYQEFAPQLGITDFSPASQDAIALAILNACGAVSALDNGDVTAAFTAASKRWASLPGSTAGQHPQALQTAIAAFEANGGVYV